MSFGTGNNFSRASLTGFASLASGGRAETVSVADATGATTLDLIDGNIFNITLTGDVTFTFAGTTSGKACSFTLYCQQNVTGGKTVTWPASVNWPGGGAPTLTTASNAIDILEFKTVDDGTTWYGSLNGANYS